MPELFPIRYLVWCINYNFVFAHAFYPCINSPLIANNTMIFYIHTAVIHPIIQNKVYNMY